MNYFDNLKKSNYILFLSLKTIDVLPVSYKFSSCPRFIIAHEVFCSQPVCLEGSTEIVDIDSSSFRCLFGETSV